MAAAALELEGICITNHGEIGDYEIFAKKAPPELSVIPGVEITSPEGDFMIFSSDRDYLGSLDASQSLPDRDSRPSLTAVVWAHPFAGNPAGIMSSPQYIRGIATRIDAIEVYNGNWPDEEASDLARRIASEFGLAELGGSDSHRHESLMRCHTRIEGGIKNAAELVAAILERRTAAVGDSSA